MKRSRKFGFACKNSNSPIFTWQNYTTSKHTYQYFLAIFQKQFCCFLWQLVVQYKNPEL